MITIEENSEEWMYEEEEDGKETYESLWEWKLEQDRLIAEGKIEKPQIIDGFDEESWEAVRNNRTLEVVLKSIEEKYGKR